MVDIDRISGDVLDLSIRLHRELGPGLLESVYETVLAAHLETLGYCTRRQVPTPILFEGRHFDAVFRADILVESQIIVEVKSTNHLHPAHTKQLLTYLRLARLPLGLLVNFGGVLLKDEFKRIVNDYKPLVPRE